MFDPDHVVVTSTVDSEASARQLAGDVVAARLGACAQIIPITSVFRWNSDVQTETEWRIEIKTASTRAAELVDYIKAKHSYDEPEIVITPILGGSPTYLDWLVTETL